VPWLRFVPLAVTTAVPTAVIDCKAIVAIPEEAFFVVLPSNVPCPETLNVNAFVAVVTIAFVLSHTIDVTNDVLAPFAYMLEGDAVFITLLGGAVAVTFTAPWVRLLDVAVTTAVPTAVADLNVIVAMPPEAFFVLAPSSVPSPETVNVNSFVAVVTVLLLLSLTLDVTSDVDAPSAIIATGLAVFITFEGIPVIITFTVPGQRLEPVVFTVAVPAVVADRRIMVATPLEAFPVVVPSSVPAPVTVNVKTFVAVVTVLSSLSVTREVISEVAVPSATIVTGLAVLIIFTDIDISFAITKTRGAFQFIAFSFEAYDSLLSA